MGWGELFVFTWTKMDIIPCDFNVAPTGFVFVCDIHVYVYARMHLRQTDGFSLDMQELIALKMYC